MTDTQKSLLRTLLSAIGAFLIGNHLSPTHVIEMGDIDLWAGLLASGVSFLISVFTKQIGTDMILAGIKSISITLGTLATTYGFLTANDASKYVGLILAVIGFIGDLVVKKQNANTLANPLNARKLSKL